MSIGKQRRAAWGLGGIGVALLLQTACVAIVDNSTIKKALPSAMSTADVGMSCAMGESLTGVIEGMLGQPPHKSLVLTYMSAAMCAEGEVWRNELDVMRADRNFEEWPTLRLAERSDARTRKSRAHELAALRYLTAWEHMQLAYGLEKRPLAEKCPKLRSDEEQLLFLLGLTSGLNALVHDRGAQGAVGVPVDVIHEVSAGSRCVDDDQFWGVPGALRAAAEISIPGSDPNATEAWAALDEAVLKGQADGVRLAGGLASIMAGSFGLSDKVEGLIRDHAASLEATPSHVEWRMLDAYATAMIQHQSDKLWIETKGHRTPHGKFGEFPVDALEMTMPDDIENPF